MNSPFPRIGSKKSIRDKILPYIQPHRVYVEPFCGSASIYFTKEPAEVSVLNDLDINLMKAYQTIRNGYDPYYERYDTTSVEAMTEFFQEDNDDPRHNLAKEIMKSNTFGSKGYGKLYKNANPYKKLSKLDAYRDFMHNTMLFSEDYREMLVKFDRDETFFFIDPPYEASTGLYDHDTVDLREMAVLLSKVKGKFLLTLNFSKTVKEIFDGFNTKMIIVKGSNNTGIGSTRRRELLIMNY